MANMNTNLDDWETDPDFVRDMDEMDQRWGNKRTVGSINMNELIDDVRRDHKTIRENNHHSSQLDYSSGLDRNVKPQVSQKTVSRKIITERSERSYVEDSTVLNEKPIIGTIVDRSSTSHKPNPNISPKPNMSDITSRLYSSGKSTFTSTEKGQQQTSDSRAGTFETVPTDPPKQFKESSVTKRIFEEKSSSSSPSSRDNIPTSKSPSTGVSTSAAFKSIQDKIDAFKKEFEQIENKVAKKSDISKVIKKSTNTGKFDDTVKYVTRSTEKLEHSNRPKQQRATTTSPTEKNRSSSSDFRPSSTSPLFADKRQEPKSSIKSLSERFESLGRETSEDFRRRMEERRREFFDEIKTQVRETRKELDGFDVLDSDEEDSRLGGNKKREGQMSTMKPKVYTKRETTQEEIVSKFVKENDRVVHDETKRNVERTSSCHGSSEDEEPTSIKYINRTLKTSPQPARGSPIDELKQKLAFAEPTNKSSGLMARTLYDYQAAEGDELSFDVDDLITNIEKLDQGWYKGTIVKNGQKKVGLFPANYVKLLNDSTFY